MRAKRGVSAEVKDGAPESVKTARDFGFALRVIKEGRVGFSYGTRREDAAETVKSAVEAARYTEEDRYERIPPPSGGRDRTPSCPEIYDERVAEMTAALALEKAVMMEKAAMTADGRIRQVRSAVASFSAEDVLIFNSEGTSRIYSSTGASAQLMAVAEEAGETQMGWEFSGSAFLEDIDFWETGGSAARKALMMLGAKKISPFKGAVVLERSVAAEFLGILSRMLSADAVQKGRSLLAGKTGEKVVGGNLDIIDDGLLPRGLGTRPIDDEGIAASKKTLIEKGVLKGFMHNSHTAAKAGTASTGNAIKSGLSSMPSVSPLNIYLSAPGRTRPLGELFKDAGRGIYVIEAMGMHTANPVSGDFSVGVSGLRILENGEPGHPVKEAVISGNILSFFESVELVGDDLKFFGTAGSPSVLASHVDISG
jgi:PmbA protein